MSFACPDDASLLQAQGQRLHCPSCGHDFRLRGRCGDCGEELERLLACGASNWFCNHCNELKSKSRVTTDLVRID